MGGCGGHTKFLLVPSFQNMYRLFTEICMELAIPASCQNPASSQMANFGQFLAKMAKTVKIIKKHLENFSQAYTKMCEVSEKK